MLATRHALFHPSHAYYHFEASHGTNHEILLHPNVAPKRLPKLWPRSALRMHVCVDQYRVQALLTVAPFIGCVLCNISETPVLFLEADLSNCRACLLAAAQ